MIRVKRSDQAVGTATASVRSKALAELRSSVSAGTSPLDYKGSVYGSASIRKHLWSSQHEKCCYCEKKIEDKFQHVEHFRPKGRARRTNGAYQGGYWWLTYDLDNLLFACQDCNTNKQDWFPLESGVAPLTPEQSPAATPEQQTLVDPLREDPDQHIGFVQLPTGKWRIAGRTPRGEETIQKLKLHRDSLDRLRDNQRAVSGYQPNASDSAPFAALLRTP